jgi:hypothetical protein
MVKNGGHITWGKMGKSAETGALVVMFAPTVLFFLFPMLEFKMPRAVTRTNLEIVICFCAFDSVTCL